MNAPTMQTSPQAFLLSQEEQDYLLELVQHDIRHARENYLEPADEAFSIEALILSVRVSA